MGTDRKRGWPVIGGLNISLPKESTITTLSGIDQALRQNNKLIGFSYEGLMVMRVEEEIGDGLVAYGEHPSAWQALRLASQNFLTGGETHQVVDGQLPQAALDFESKLNQWIHGRQIIVAQEDSDGQILVELVIVTKPWRRRAASTVRQAFSHIKNIAEPAIKEEDQDWIFHIRQSGKGSTFTQALSNAFEALQKEERKNNF